MVYKSSIDDYEVIVVVKRGKHSSICKEEGKNISLEKVMWDLDNGVGGVGQ